MKNEDVPLTLILINLYVSRPISFLIKLLINSSFIKLLILLVCNLDLY